MVDTIDDRRRFVDRSSAARFTASILISTMSPTSHRSLVHIPPLCPYREHAALTVHGWAAPAVALPLITALVCASESERPRCGGVNPRVTPPEDADAAGYTYWCEREAFEARPDRAFSFINGSKFSLQRATNGKIAMVAKDRKILPVAMLVQNIIDSFPVRGRPVPRYLYKVASGHVTLKWSSVY